MNKEELAWAAGFFDGEGNFNFTRDTIIAQIHQIHLEVLEKFKKSVSVGIVYYKPYIKEKYSPCYYYSCTNFEGVQFIICCLWPWLGTIKRQQALKVLWTYKAYQALFTPKITSKDKQEIKYLYQIKGYKLKDLGLKYNISPSTLDRIINSNKRNLFYNLKDGRKYS